MVPPVFRIGSTRTCICPCSIAGRSGVMLLLAHPMFNMSDPPSFAVTPWRQATRGAVTWRRPTAVRASIVAFSSGRRTRRIACSTQRLAGTSRTSRAGRWRCRTEAVDVVRVAEFPGLLQDPLEVAAAGAEELPRTVGPRGVGHGVRRCGSRGAPGGREADRSRCGSFCG